MGTYNYKYYEPLEQMMAIRHQYMSKILRDHNGQDIYEFFNNKRGFRSWMWNWRIS